ncbi:hypothetical protein J2Z75_005522 [Rhizobium herbae]|uniref:Tn3 transposase DDE domain-containing protein n=1 Tax=Rhizobium herbae TaxID=508661 RepID=A0ABS4EVK2_9HYPH|nr:Tn3 family transposase [Rhizobium herbae]MBP1861991.1 hypothetical protein [Rhizobium herbae]
MAEASGRGGSSRRAQAENDEIGGPVKSQVPCARLSDFHHLSVASDFVFALFDLIGRPFGPRLRNIKDRKLHAFEKADAYPAMANLIPG